MAETRADRLVKSARRAFAEAREVAESEGYLATWADLARYFAPRRGLTLEGKAALTSRGTRKRQYIIDSTPEFAVRVQAAGMQSGLTSPSRVWFRLMADDPDLNQFRPVKEFWTKCRDILLQRYAKTNAYNMFYNLHLEGGVFGTSAALIREDLDRVHWCHPFTIGEYYLTADSYMRPDSIYIRTFLTAPQLAREFGEGNLPREVVNTLKTERNHSRLFPLLHIIRPRELRNLEKLDKFNMPYESLYVLEEGSDGPPGQALLREGGYREKPFISPRWSTVGPDVYGESNGMAMLGDNKQLQKMTKDKLLGIAKMVDPPVTATGHEKPRGGNVAPGGVTTVQGGGQDGGYRPAYMVDPRIEEVRRETADLRERIKTGFFNDIFLAVLQETKAMTAYETSERFEEKVQMLSPLVERQIEEMLDPFIHRTFMMELRAGNLPPVPRDLQGQDWKVEYVGPLAQAQKLAGLTAQQQVVGMIGALANIYPEVRDKADADRMLEHTVEMVGAPPDVLRSRSQTAAIRQRREAQEQAQAALEQGQNLSGAAQAGKTLSETDLEKESALKSIMEAAQ